MKLWTNGVDTVIAVDAADALEVAVEFYGEEEREAFADNEWRSVTSPTYVVWYESRDDIDERIPADRVEARRLLFHSFCVEMPCDDWIRIMGRGWLGSTET